MYDVPSAGVQELGLHSSGPSDRLAAKGNATPVASGKNSKFQRRYRRLNAGGLLTFLTTLLYSHVTSVYVVRSWLCLVRVFLLLTSLFGRKVKSPRPEPWRTGPRRETSHFAVVAGSGSHPVTDGYC